MPLPNVGHNDVLLNKAIFLSEFFSIESYKGIGESAFIQENSSPFKHFGGLVTS